MTEQESSMEPHCADIAVNGIQTHVRRAGSGRDMILVHGGDFRTFGHGADWDPLVPFLAPDFSVVAPDRLGQGRTANPPEASGYTMSASATHLISLVDALALDGMVVIGHSRGALPALFLALERKARVGAVVLLDSNTLNTTRPAPAGFYAGVFDDPPQPLTTEHVLREVRMNSFSPDHISSRYATQLLTAGNTEPAAHRRHLMQSDLYDRQFLPDLAQLRDGTLARIDGGELTMPTLVIWGNDDPSAPLTAGIDLFQRLAAAGTPAQLHVVTRAGHYPHREQPARIAQVITGFLATTDRAPEHRPRTGERLSKGTYVRGRS